MKWGYAPRRAFPFSLPFSVWRVLHSNYRKMSRLCQQRNSVLQFEPSSATDRGVPGCVGEAADLIGPRGRRPFSLIGYIPHSRPDDAPKDEGYDAWVECGEEKFSAEQILRNWTDILDAGVLPQEVRLLGFGGGAVSAVEYRIALGLGACVGLVEGSGGAADGLLADDLWAGETGLLLALPCDRTSARALAHPPRSHFDDAKKLHDCLVPWEDLSDGDNGFKKYDRDAVRKFPDILAKAGLQVCRP